MYLLYERIWVSVNRCRPVFPFPLSLFLAIKLLAFSRCLISIHKIALR
jgi:hypothetical protein